MQEVSSKFKCRFEPRKNKIPLQDFYMSCKSCLRLSVTFLALRLVYFTRTMQLTISKWMISSSVAIQGFSPLMPYKIKRILLQEYWETGMLKMKVELRLQPGLWFIFPKELSYNHPELYFWTVKCIQNSNCLYTDRIQLCKATGSNKKSWLPNILLSQFSSYGFIMLVGVQQNISSTWRSSTTV